MRREDTVNEAGVLESIAWYDSWPFFDSRGPARESWGKGPWQDEPDKVQWVDEATGLDCLIVRNPLGSLCGYVGLPPQHPLHGQDHQTVDDLRDVDVHGGLTFADSCMEDAAEGAGVCHVPFPGRPGDVWWLGFDCGHAGDHSPAMEARMVELPGINREAVKVKTADERSQHHMLVDTYKSVAYVTAETEHLAKQLFVKQLPA